MKTILSLVLMVSLLSGCMYPAKDLVQNQIPYKDQLQSVQAAVVSYRKDHGGLLPIKTEAANTPIYQKYPIDFTKLVPQYLSEPPGNAYESGGDFEYVLINDETNPTVKLFDLRITATIQDIKLRIKSLKYPPFKGIIANNVFSLDFKKLGYDKPPYAISPFTQQKLPFVITGTADVYVDYRLDLAEVLKKEKVSVIAGEDIRPILVKNSMFVPAYSLPYTISSKQKEPIFLANNQ